MKESAIQSQIRHLLDLRGIWYVRNNSGVAMMPGRNGSKMPVRFGAPGMPDIVCFFPHGAPPLWIEVKTATGRLSPAQVAWRERAHAHRHHHIVARSVEDVEAALALFGYGSVLSVKAPMTAFDRSAIGEDG